MAASNGDPRPPRPEEPRAEPIMKRGLGVPWLFAAANSAVGFSI